MVSRRRRVSVQKRLTRVAQRCLPLYSIPVAANTERNQARLQVVLAALLFSTGGAGIKLDAFTVPQVSMLRSGIAAIALLILMRRRLSWSPTSAVAGVVYAATLTLFVGATKLTTAANAIFLQSTAPLYLLFLAPLFLQERIYRRHMVYLSGVAVGMAFCFTGQAVPTTTAPSPALGNVLGLLSGVAWAFTLLTLRLIGRADVQGGTAATAVIAGNIVAFLAAFPLAVPLPAAPIEQWATLVYLGVFQIGLAYVCLTAAIRHLPAIEISLLLLLEPVLNPIWTWLIRGEEPGTWTIAGGMVIVAATAAKVVYDARYPVAVSPPSYGRRISTP